MVGRPKEFDPDAALEGAIDLFWSKGFEGCSLSALVDEMQINRQSLYDTYGDKRTLFLAVLTKYVERVGGEIREALSKGKTPLARIRNFLKLLSSRLTGDGGSGCLLTNTMVELGPHDEEIRELVADRWTAIETALSDLLQQAIDGGEIRQEVNARQIARLLLTIMQGAIVLSKAKMKESVRDALKSADSVLRDLE